MECRCERKTYVRYLRTNEAGRRLVIAESEWGSDRHRPFCQVVSEEQVWSRDSRLLVPPEEAFGFYFVDQYEVVIRDGGRPILLPLHEVEGSRSKTYFCGGTVVNRDEVRAAITRRGAEGLPPGILALNLSRNMQKLGLERVIRTREGRDICFQPFEADDEIVVPVRTADHLGGGPVV